MIQDFPHIAVEAKRRLLDILTDEFEKLRRFVTLFNMPMSELEVRRPDLSFIQNASPLTHT